jgi:hypothetical protein
MTGTLFGAALLSLAVVGFGLKLSGFRSLTSAYGRKRNVGGGCLADGPSGLSVKQEFSGGHVSELLVSWS